MTRRSRTPFSKRALFAVVVLALVAGMVTPTSVMAGANPTSDEGTATSQRSALAQDGDGGQTAAVETELEEIAAATAGDGSADSEAQVNDSSQSRDRLQAARDGALSGAELAERRGVDISQADREAAVQATLRAVNRTEVTDVDEIAAASQGAAHGALLQSQRANVSQIQAGIFGGTLGSLTQSQTVGVTQIQSASYGAAHGAVAQSQQANVTQIQYAAAGAAAGACADADETAEDGQEANATQTQRVNVTQVQEAAQGAAYGALSQRQAVSVRQRQAAAYGSAAGGSDDEAANPKKVQEGALGGATGALRSQEASVTQIQSAARGGTSGALVQSQRVDVTQIQSAASGAAGGAVSQYQSASITQIQSAASGAAEGSLNQTQQVDVVQISEAAFGAASGAAGTAAQQQIVDVDQIQSAARGAGSGAVIQIQQINVVQIQIIAQSAAGGALSQHQSASSEQMQSAAKGASEGALSLSLRQEMSVTQIQEVTQRAAADTASVAAEIDIDNDVTIVTYARGSAENPDDDDEVSFQSLFVNVLDDGVSLANPNEASVTVTITSEEDTLQTETLAAGEQLTVDLDPGQYTLTAETADGEDIEIAGRDELRISVGDDQRSLDVTVEDRSVTVLNPNDQRVTVTAMQDGQRVEVFDVPPNWDVTQRFEPGDYTLTAESDDGRAVPVEDRDEYEITVEQEPEPPIDLDVSVANGNVSVANPNETAVVVTATDDAGDDLTIDVPGDETVSESLEPGNYTLTGETGTETNRTVLLNGEESADIEIEAEPVQQGPIDLNATVDDGNLTLETPPNASVTATVTDDDGDEQTVDVPAGESVTELFEPGNYTVTAEADGDRQVLIDGEEQFEFSVAPEPPIDLDVTVTEDTVSIENPSGTAVEVTATENGTEATVTIDVPAAGNETEQLDPGNYTLTGEPVEGDQNVTFEGRETYPVPIQRPGPTPQIASCTVIDQSGEYELTSDISSDTDGTCIRIAASDVTLRGNGNTVSGTGSNESIGVEVYSSEIDEITNVTIRNLETENWGTGVYLGNFSDDIQVQGTVENVAVTDNVGSGIYLVNADGSTVENVTASGTDGDGITVWESTDLSFTDITATENGGRGIYLWDLVSDSEFTAIRVTDNGGDGLFGDLGSNNTFDGLSIDGNAGHGIELADSGENLFRNSRITDNGALGINFRGSDDQRLQNVTVRGHPGPEIGFRDAFGPVPYDATDLFLEPAARFEFTGEPVILDTIGNESLPALPENATPVQSGVNVSNVQEQVTVTVPIESGTDATEVELLRFDGSEWESETAGSAVDDGDALQATVTESGVYVPVRTEPLSAIDIDAAVENDTLTLENPSDASVTATVAPEDGENRTIEVPADEPVTESFDPGNYTVTAESDDERSVLLDGNETFQFAVAEAGPPEPIELTVSVANGSVEVENPTDTGVVVTATNATGDEQTFDVEGTQTETQELTPGEYTLSGETEPETSRPVLLNGEESYNVTVEPAEPEEPIDLNVTVEDGVLTVTNPSDTVVTVTAAEADVSLTVDAGETVTETLDPGNYTLTGESERPVTLNGEDELAVEVPTTEAFEPLETSLSDGELTIENPTEELRLVRISNESGPIRTLEVPADDETTTTLNPGTYTVEATTSGGEPVLVDGQSEIEVTVESTVESLEASVEEGSLTIQNPNDVDATVTVTSEDDEDRTIEVPAEDDVTEEFEPGEYRLTAQTEAGTNLPINDQRPLTIEITRPELESVSAATDDGTLTVDNPNEIAVTVTAAPTEGENVTLDVGASESASVDLDAGTYELTAESTDDRSVQVNGERVATVSVEGPTTDEPEEAEDTEEPTDTEDTEEPTDTEDTEEPTDTEDTEEPTDTEDTEEPEQTETVTPATAE